MILNTSSVDLEGITSSVSRSQFDESELEYLANLFLKSGDTVSPILLREKSPIAFEVLAGHREYYAALKAQEIDSRFESIRAYIVPSDRENSILEQYEYFHTSNTVAQPNSNLSNSNSIDQKILISAIEQSIAKQINPLKSSLQDVNAKLAVNNSSSNNSTDQFSILNVVEKLSQRVLVIEEALIEIKKFLIKPDKSEKVLHDFNNLSRDELEQKIRSAGVISKAKSFAQGIYDGRQSKPYNSLLDIKVAQLGKVTMEKIISNW